MELCARRGLRLRFPTDAGADYLVRSGERATGQTTPRVIVGPVLEVRQQSQGLSLGVFARHVQLARVRAEPWEVDANEDSGVLFPHGDGCGRT